MPRYIVFGAGAIGGTIGASLVEHNQDVVLIARGAHFEAIRSSGLQFETPTRSVTHEIAAVNHPSEIDFRAGDVVLLTVKTQDSLGALEALRSCAPASIPVVCVQNGVENERIALRLFENVYGAMIISPATHLSPGVVMTNSTPLYGLLQIGRYPAGSDALSKQIAADLSNANWIAEACETVMDWKYTKLLGNLNNTIQLVLGLNARGGEVANRARAEGSACLEAAGIPYVPLDDLQAWRSKYMTEPQGTSSNRAGSSTWQSLVRGLGSVETDYLNGEIVLLGRLVGIPTPVNELLQRMADELAREKKPPMDIPESELIAMLNG